MKKNWMIVSLLSALAALIYFASMAGYAFPGESARLQVLWSGLELTPQVRYPLMAVFARLLGCGNLIAPICGVLSVAFIYLLVSRFVAFVSRSEEAIRQKETLGRVAGVSAAILYMLTPAVHEAASHLEPRLFEATWALGIFLLVIPYRKAPSYLGWLYPILMGALVALGFCDTSLYVMLAPFYLAAIVLTELTRGNRPYRAVTLFSAAFLAMFFVSLESFGLKLTPFLRLAGAEFKAFYHTPGWVFVTIFTTIPFLVSIFSAFRAFGEKSSFVQFLFHLAMSLFAILAIATPLAPSSLLGSVGVCPVVTSAYAAIFAGYLIAYWWLRRAQAFSVAAGVVLVFTLTFASVWNLCTFDSERGAFADRVAARVLDDLGERTWLVTDGTLDDHLLLCARRKGRELNLIALQRDLDTAYLSELGKRVKKLGIGGSKNEALSLSLTLGVLPFVQDWFAGDPMVDRQVAVWGAPDLWYSADRKPVPELLFFGADKTKAPDWTAWKQLDELLHAPKGWGSYRFGMSAMDPVEFLRLSLRRHVGLLANNHGVALLDAKRDDEAFAQFELVLNEIDTDNVSALFNEIEMAGHKHPKALSKKLELERRIKSIVDDKSRRYVIWRLSSFYGYIRNPEMFVRLGFAWARSGRPGDALAQIRRAIDFIPTDKRAALLNMMAALYAAENDQKKSRKIYESILEKNANDHEALIGMMRLKLLDGDAKAALSYLERAVKSSPAEGRRAQIELAMVLMMKNDLDGSRKMLRKVIDSDAKNLQAWSLLAAVTMQQIDAAKDESVRKNLVKEIEETILPQMEKNSNNPNDYYVQTTRAFMLMRQGVEKHREARDAFVVAARARPESAIAQDLVLGLDISLDDRVNAEHHAREVLRKNRNAPLANYVMGSLAIRRGQYSEAEAFLRKAANAPQPNVLALNDLAEVLRRVGNLSEAERYVRSAIEIAPKFYILHETLAVILMDQKRNAEEALGSVRKAIELAKMEKGDVDVRLYATQARAQMLMGDRKGARVSVRMVQGRLNELSEFEKGEFEEIRKSVQ